MSEEKEYTKVNIEKPTEEEIQEEKEMVDMAKEIDDLEESVRDSEEGNSFMEEPIDYSKVEFDSNGIPVITIEDIKNFSIFDFMGIPREMLATQIQMMYQTLLEFVENQKLSDDNPDKVVYTEQQIKEIQEAKDFLARIQLKSRDKEEIIRSNRIHQASEQGIIFNIFTVALFKNYILENKDLFSKDLSIFDNLKQENYTSIFLKMMKLDFDDYKLDILDYITEPYRITNIADKYNSIFKRVFFYLSNFFRYKAASHTEKTINTLSSSLIDKFYDAFAVSIVHNEDLQKKFIDKVFKSKDPNKELSEDEKIESIRNQLEKNKAYQEFMNYTNKDEVLNKMYSIANKVFENIEKLTSDFKLKKDFINHLIILEKELTEKMNSIMNNYKIEIKPEDENLLFEKFATTIIENVKKYDDPPKDETSLLSEDRKSVQITDEESLEEMYKNYIDDNAQAIRDDYTVKHYPVLEKVKLYKNLSEAIAYYLSDTTNKDYAYKLIVTLVHYIVQDLSFKTLYKNFIMRMYDQSYTNLMIPLETRIEDILSNQETMSAIKNSYSANSLGSKFKELLTGNLLYDMASCTSISEFSDTSDDYMDNMYKFYNALKEPRIEMKIMALCYMFDHNRLDTVRYKILDLSLDLLLKTLDSFDSIYDENAYHKKEMEKEKLLESAEKYRLKKANKRKRRSKK